VTTSVLPKLDPTAVANTIAVENGLTRREKEVLMAAAQGKCTKEIAVDLGLSGKTVDYFWKKIFRKLRCGSQGQVMALLLRRACGGNVPPQVLSVLDAR